MMSTCVMFVKRMKESFMSFILLWEKQPNTMTKQLKGVKEHQPRKYQANHCPNQCCLLWKISPCHMLRLRLHLQVFAGTNGIHLPGVCRVRTHQHWKYRVCNHLQCHGIHLRMPSCKVPFLVVPPQGSINQTGFLRWVLNRIKTSNQRKYKACHRACQNGQRILITRLWIALPWQHLIPKQKLLQTPLIRTGRFLPTLYRLHAHHHRIVGKH